VTAPTARPLVSLLLLAFAVAFYWGAEMTFSMTFIFQKYFPTFDLYIKYERTRKIAEATFENLLRRFGGSSNKLCKWFRVVHCFRIKNSNFIYIYTYVSGN
jgi:hypothetical protein